MDDADRIFDRADRIFVYEKTGNGAAEQNFPPVYADEQCCGDGGGRLSDQTA